MGETGDFDTNTVVNVLTQGLELATELKKQLNPAAASKHMCDSLLEKILASYDNALKLVDCVALLGNGKPSSQIGEEGLEQDSANHASQDGSKKRKTLPKWIEQVKVGNGTTGFEGQLDDGYNWRKYGQKNILGCNNPRAYYRCTHRNTQGCLATKHVQRADGDPSLIEISYRGKHSCMQDRIKQHKEIAKKQDHHFQTQPQPQPQPQKTMIADLPILKPQLDQEPNTSQEPFLFPSARIESANMETKIFHEPGTGTSYSSPFLSPETSESYFSFSQCNVNDFGIGQSSESDFGEIISNLNPNPGAGADIFEDWDISINDLDFLDYHFVDFHNS